MKCIDCAYLGDLKIASTAVKCSMFSNGTAEFMTTYTAARCHQFTKAPDAAILKRMEWIGRKK